MEEHKRKVLYVPGLDDNPEDMPQSSSYQLDTTVYKAEETIETTPNKPLPQSKKVYSSDLEVQVPKAAIKPVVKKSKELAVSVLSGMTSYFKTMLAKKPTVAKPDPGVNESSVNQSMQSDCDMSITQPGAAPPLREFRQFDRFQDQLRAMREESEELRNQAIFKIDDVDDD